MTDGAGVNWFVPDLHGNTAASLEAGEARLTNAIRYDAYGETILTGKDPAAAAPVGPDAWKYQGRLDVSPAGLATPLFDMRR